MDDLLGEIAEVRLQVNEGAVSGVHVDVELQNRCACSSVQTAS
jgi:hypothetical protein